MEASTKGLYFPLDYLGKKYEFLLTLRNPTDKVIAFKVKTTHPHDLTAEPRLGELQSNQTQEMAVTWLADNSNLTDPNDFSTLSPPRQPRMMIEQSYPDDASGEKPKPIIFSAFFTSPDEGEEFRYKLNGVYQGDASSKGAPKEKKRHVVKPPNAYENGDVEEMGVKSAQRRGSRLSLGDRSQGGDDDGLVPPPPPVTNYLTESDHDLVSRSSDYQRSETERRRYLRDQQNHRVAMRRYMDEEARERAERAMRERSVDRMKVVADQVYAYNLSKTARDQSAARDCTCIIS